MVSAIFASSFPLISQQDTFPPSARSTTWRRVEPSLTCLSSAINIQHSLSLHKLHSVIAVGYTDEFSHAFFFFFNVFLINLLFPRHSGWEFQKHSLFSYLCSHCSPTGLTLPQLISRGLPQASKAARWDGNWALWKTHSPFFPCV